MTTRPTPLAIFAAGFSFIMAAGCGEPSADITGTLSVSLPITIGDCTAAATDFGDRLGATLRIGGHDDCELHVETSAGTADGSCEDVYFGDGVVRPLTLVWYVDPIDDTMTRVPVSYQVAFVDLQSSLESGATVDVDFTDDAENGLVLWDPAQMTCPGPDCDIPTTSDSNLDDAVLWTVNEMIERGDPTPILDRDGDACPNLVEACLGGVIRLYESTTPDTECLDAAIFTP